MSDIVYHDTEALESPDAEQRHITWFGKHYLVYGFKTLGTYDGVAGFACHLLLGSRGEIASAHRPHFDARQDVFGQPAQLRP